MSSSALKVIAHRGFSGKAPENTLAAFDLALRRAVDGIEFDVRFSRDREVMIIHDDKLNRTTNGSGRVHELPRQAIQELDAGSWFGSAFAGERIPTLSDLLRFLGNRRPLLVLELKPDPRLPPDYVERILAPLQGNPEWLPRLVVLSFDHTLLPAFLQRDPRIRCGTLIEHKGDPVEPALRVGARIVALRRNLVSEAVVRRIHEAELQIMVWTVDREREIQRLCQMNVDAIISNYPDRVLRLREPEAC